MVVAARERVCSMSSMRCNSLAVLMYSRRICRHTGTYESYSASLQLATMCLAVHAACTCSVTLA
jgi:hypothetical protein